MWVFPLIRLITSLFITWSLDLKQCELNYFILDTSRILNYQSTPTVESAVIGTAPWADRQVLF
jgi:hypothetical protein